MDINQRIHKPFDAESLEIPPIFCKRVARPPGARRWSANAWTPNVRRKTPRQCGEMPLPATGQLCLMWGMNWTELALAKKMDPINTPAGPVALHG
jgi:hypothetical protein